MDRQHRREVAVTSDLSASALGSGDVPVLATPAVLALAEGSCAALLAEDLAEGETSVGLHAEVEHIAATPVGRHVTVEATLTDRDGRHAGFDVVVREGGEVVATVRHRRVVVDRERFLERAGATDD
jgi:predicted thioesterase